MASPEEKVGAPATDDGLAHGEGVLVEGERLGPESDNPNYSQVDPDDTTSKELKEQAEEGKKESEEGKKDSKKSADNLKATLIISGVVVAVIGAIFAIAKKIKEA